MGLRGSIMRQPACIILIVLICLSGLTIIDRTEAVSVSISGIFTSDFTLLKANSPYNLTGNVIVASGATLTIEPGVTVNMGNYRIDVNGTLSARGTNTEKIIFQKFDQWYNNPIVFLYSCTPWNEQTGQGCIIENAVLNSISIRVHGSPKISNCEINRQMLIVSGSPLISNNNVTIIGDGAFNIISGSPRIYGNTIRGNGFFLDGIYGLGTIDIQENVISGFENGININSGNYTVTSNTISQCKNGITASSGSIGIISRNLINNNSQYGIHEVSAYISENTITNNQVGIHNPKWGTFIFNNNILGNSQYGLTTSTDPLTAYNNWWGTTNLDVINQLIYDKKDDPTLGEVAFEPIANSTIQTAPEIPELIYPLPSFDPSADPTPSTNVEPTPKYTPMPTVEPDRPKTGKDQTSPFYSINTLVIAVAVPLLITWLIVILGYSLKSKISSFKAAIKS